MKKLKLIRNVLAVLAVLATVVFISCGALLGDGQSGNITINLPPISSQARAISSDKISDLKNVTTSYRVTANGMTREGTGGTFTFTLPVGVVAEITVECLNSSGNVIVRAKKTHTVTAGVNNVDIILSRDGDVVGTGGDTPSGGNPPTPPAPQPSYRKLSTAQVGDVICANGKVLSASDITTELQSQTIAVVYKVDTNARKVWAVGKELSGSSMMWADSSADGYRKNITDLQESNYSDGSTGLSILQREAPDAATDLENMYPAWDYAYNYGTKQGLTSFQTGWYLPSKQELQEVYDQKDNLPSALLNFRSNYWCSSQFLGVGSYAFTLTFGSGSWGTQTKDKGYYVCAVRAFTY